MNNIKAIISLVRVEQWVKNFFVFIPLFFAGLFLDGDLLIRTTLAFAAFCLISGVVYIINDLADIEADRQHPKKKFRPLASGQISKQKAKWIAAVCIVIALSLSVKLSVSFTGIVSMYLLINLGYSFGLKKIALLDITIIAIGFLLRVFGGGVVAQIPVSHWLILMTFLLAMILALGKRREEFLAFGTSTKTRPSLEGYNLAFIDMAMVMMTAVAVVAYLMYTLSTEVTTRIGSDQLYITTFFVILGLLRYLQLAMVYRKAESPTQVLLQDRFIQFVLLGWIGIFGWMLYAN